MGCLHFFNKNIKGQTCRHFAESTRFKVKFYSGKLQILAKDEIPLI